jgi:hypothetical protein
MLFWVTEPAITGTALAEVFRLSASEEEHPHPVVTIKDISVSAQNTCLNPRSPKYDIDGGLPLLLIFVSLLLPMIIPQSFVRSGAGSSPEILDSFA